MIMNCMILIIILHYLDNICMYELFKHHLKNWIVQNKY